MIFISTSRSLGRNVIVNTTFGPASSLALMMADGTSKGRGDYLYQELPVQCYVHLSSVMPGITASEW